MEKSNENRKLSTPILAEREKRKIKRPSPALLEEKKGKKHISSLKKTAK